MIKWVVYLILALLLFGLPFIAYTADEYVGAKKCKLCHIKIYKSWDKTKHSSAFNTLSPGVAAEAKKKAHLDPQKDYSSDPECIECHTTDNSIDFPGIQCEACHGAGKKFTAIGIMNKKLWQENPDKQRKLAFDAGLIVKPDEALCRKCHNEKSPTFKPLNFADQYKEVSHKTE